jgi:hypothetical protein
MPLAKPQVLTNKQVETFKHQKGFRKFFRGSRLGSGTREIVWKPFVVPFLGSSHTLSFLPRLVSYYEMTMTRPANDSTVVNNHQERQTPHSQENSDAPIKWSSECIAIGLANKDYPMKDTMPGWKSLSYGYHSDDGSTFGDGKRQIQYGPKFGLGDVVGCGLDYRTGTVFYTLNGIFLGHASVVAEEALIAVDWYPTVGFDSPECAVMNFGFHKPFVFDLLKYCQEDPPARVTYAMEETNQESTYRRRQFKNYILRVILSTFGISKRLDAKKYRIKG